MGSEGKASASALKSITKGTVRALYHALGWAVLIVLSNEPSDTAVWVVNILEYVDFPGDVVVLVEFPLRTFGLHVMSAVATCWVIHFCTSE